MNLQFANENNAANKKEEGFKNQNRRRSFFNIHNRLKNSLILQAPSKLNNSISKIRMEKRLSNNEGSIIKDYLHFHKFGVQRNDARKVSRKSLKGRSSIGFIHNSLNPNEYISMIYYPKEKNNKKIEAQIIELGKEKAEKTNLKHIENILFNKLNNMKFDIEQNEVIKDLNNDNNDYDNVINLKNFDNSSTNTNNNLSLNNSYYKNKFKNKKNKSINSAFSHQNSIKSNNSNIKSSFCPIPKENDEKQNFNIKEVKIKSEILQIPYEKSTLNSEKKFLVLTDANHQFQNKLSSKSVNSNFVIKEKSRMLNRIKPLYDSFDDDESDKEDEDYSNVLLPYSPIIFILDIFLFLSSLYTLFYIPLRMAKAECFCIDEHTLNKALLYFVDILYICDFCISFFRAYYNFQFKLIKNSKSIVIHYLQTDGIFDFLEAIPVFSLSKYFCIVNEEVNYCFKYSMSNSLILLKIATNIKIIKIFKVWSRQRKTTFYFILDLLSENYYFEKFLDNLINFSFVFLAFHFFVCLNIFLGKQTYPNWLITINTQDQTLLYNYITSSYSLIETLTTVGYGDITCQNMPERIFQIFFLGVGVIAYSYIISSFGNLIKNESQSSIKYSNNMKILEEIRIDYPNMPFKLYKKIYNYIESRSLAEKKLDANLLTNSLPFNLRNVLLLLMYESCIKNFKIFKNCDNSNFIIQILSRFVPAVSKKSEILVYEGEMIEEIVIVKDGRLSLEAAIDIEDPEESIKHYFNINFQGITSAKEMKKIEEASKKFTNSYLIPTKNVKDYDNSKFVLNTVVKRQAKYLMNSALDDISILDKTTNDNANKNEELNFLKNEPIKNEQGNYKYIKIIDIRKNENYGGLYMLMRRPSPLSLKVKSKFAELYLLPKKDAFSIAKNYNNIWSKIHKKDFHNMVSIKYQTFGILNKYIEINGIGKINQNDMSRYIYAWEDSNKNNKLNDKSYSFFSKQISNFPVKNHNLPNNKKNTKKSPINKYIHPNLTQINKNNKDNDNNINNANNNNNNINININYNNSISDDNITDKNSDNINKSIDKISPKSQYNMPIQNDVDFSKLLTLMTNNNIQNRNNINSNNNTINNNVFKSAKNINININNNKNELNLFLNTMQIKEYSHTVRTNNFNDKKQFNNSNEESKTILMPKDSEVLLPSSLSNIFNEKKVEKIKEQMNQSKKKEIFRKAISLGKKLAELFTNEKYSVFFVDKKDKLVEFENKSILTSKPLIKDNEIYKDCKLFLEKIPDISFEEEDSVKYFNEKNLIKEEVISFSFQSIYQNINTITNMKYSKNKIYQEKTLKFLKKLDDKTKASISSEDNKKLFSNFFSNDNNSSSYFSFSEKNNKESINISAMSSRKIDLVKLFSESSEDKNNKSEQLYKKKRHNQKNKNKNKNKNKGKQTDEQKFTIGNSAFSIGDLGINNNINDFQSLKPTKSINLESPKKNSVKRSKLSKNFKNNGKYTFKIETIDDKSINVNEKINSPFSKQKRASTIEKRQCNKVTRQKSNIFFFENTDNIKQSKTAKKNFLGIDNDNNNKSFLSDNKSNFKGRVLKPSAFPLKNEKNLNFNFEKDGVRNSLGYFAKEKRRLQNPIIIIILKNKILECYIEFFNYNCNYSYLLLYP